MATLTDPRRSELQRMKIGALVLLAATLSGFALSHAMGGQGVWAWVRAFCEAATVGALADWFAVVALFRRPMGLPIPHTAIIAENKNRIADNLAVFVRDHFLDPEQLMAKLKVFDPAKRLGQWLSDPAQVQRLTGLSRDWAKQALGLLDDQAVRAAIQHFVMTRLKRWDAGSSAHAVLTLLTRDGRHQALLDEALLRLGVWLGDERVRARASEIMLRFARKEWPKIVGTVGLLKPVEGISDSLAQRLARALIDELQEILTQPQHPMRQDYEAWLLAYIDRLVDDPAMNAQVDAIKQRLIEHAGMQDYVHGLWDDIQSSLRRNLDDERSTLSRHISATLAGMGARLAEDPALRDALNAHLMASAQALAGNLREGVTHHIGQTVRAWDERHLVDELELSVGKDLQYIRYNGTLVGGLIGLALHAIVVALVPGA